MDAPFTGVEVRAVVRKLANHTAPAAEGMPAELLKASGVPGICALTRLYNATWLSGQVPASWCQGVVISVFKSGDTTDCSNYRPLALQLLPVIDKLFALLLTGRLSATVALHDQQYAFRTLTTPSST